MRLHRGFPVNLTHDFAYRNGYETNIADHPQAVPDWLCGKYNHRTASRSLMLTVLLPAFLDIHASCDEYFKLFGIN